ncbi:histone deacetylase family protein [Granulosicoccus antarcticus]|uniref:Acetylpolyamine aminohydrolase n=1 Tax=Granulosicoccus antarcticus IMCC3135 TaxID=1192854 RepID=A0A2Z2NRQ7_9GAMM|nr:histone deacetylase family protein [Granulosicoccus antarcticus]ASJ74206.1 Acetylpolyamine aminohydrolase [Granulosicoccus antarcticus IMCC3135]
MKAIFDERQLAHSPQKYISNGVASTCPEQPARADALYAGAMAAGCTFDTPSDHGMQPIAGVHSPEYLVFLETIHKLWKQNPDAPDEILSSVRPDRRTASYPSSALGLAGYHQTDMSCPINSHTWESAYWSAQTALSAADLVLEGEHQAYALCRPPGHHAFSDLAGGFCFLNNSAIAADYLLGKGLKPAILDVDVHHGNGTQGIFYERDDVLTVSIHGDPSGFYPFYWGHAHERGEGRGRGYNLNLPLPMGSSDAVFLDALTTALQRIKAFGADIIVVALGLDAHEADPFQALKVTSGGFAQIGAAIAAAGLPVLFVQEGGYLQPELGGNLTSFLNGAQEQGNQ